MIATFKEWVKKNFKEDLDPKTATTVANTFANIAKAQAVKPPTGPKPLSLPVAAIISKSGLTPQMQKVVGTLAQGN